MQKRLLSIFLIISVILLSLSLFSCGNNSSDATQVALSAEEMEMPEYIRSGTGIGELDRVLGGGIVDGSVIL